MTQQDKNFLFTIREFKWSEVRRDSKRRVMDIFTSRGLTREYVAVCYGEMDLLTALKIIK